MTRNVIEGGGVHWKCDECGAKGRSIPLKVGAMSAALRRAKDLGAVHNTVHEKVKSG